MYTFTADNKAISIFPCTKSESPIIYLNTFSDEGQKVYEAVQAAGCPPFTLVSISNLDWNHDMAPWDSPPAFKNAEPCTGGANDYLWFLTKEIIPVAEKEISGAPQRRGIAGYSLAWLFALYAIHKTNLFPWGEHIWLPRMKEYLSPTSQSADQTVYTFPWWTRRVKPETQFFEKSDKTQMRFTPSIESRRLTQCFS